MSLQSDKYGYISLPKDIDRASADECLVDSTAEVQELFKKWYVVDANDRWSKYTLKSLLDINDSEFWNNALPTLRVALANCHLDPDPSGNGKELVIGRSVTEWEVKYALTKESDLDRSYWVDRRFQNVSKDMYGNKKHLFDGGVSGVQEKLDQLKVHMDGRIGAGRTKTFHSDIGPDAYDDTTGTAADKYLSAWEECVSERLERELTDMLARKVSWERNGDGLGKPGAVLLEILQHYEWARTKCSGFVGRDALLGQVMEALMTPVATAGKSYTNDFAVSVALVGVSGKYEVVVAFGLICRLIKCQLFVDYDCTSVGAGKTALMAKVASLAAEQELSSSRGTGVVGVGGAVGSGAAAVRDKTKSKQHFAHAPAGGGPTGRPGVHSNTCAVTGRPVILRFCGATAGSTNGFDLVVSICHQITLIYGAHVGPRGQSKIRSESKSDVGTESEDDSWKHAFGASYGEVVAFLQSLLETHPVLLFIDSIDQLTDADMARSKLTFLSGLGSCKLHPDTRIVLSALPDEKSADGHSFVRYYGCESTLRSADVPIIIIPKLSGQSQHVVPLVSTSASTSAEFTQVDSELQEAYQMLSHLLQQAGRGLTSEQWMHVLNQIRAEPTALYVKLCMQVVLGWKATDVVVPDDEHHEVSKSGYCVLNTTVVGLINQLFGDLERVFGVVLVEMALALITFSKNGVNDVELEDTISLQDSVLDSVFQYHAPPIRRLPSHVWSRLRSGLAGLITERENGCLKWYHRQLMETAEKRYAYMKLRAHGILGRYFGNLTDASLTEARLITSQPWVFTAGTADVPVSSDAVFTCANNRLNKRRCVEAAYGLVQGDLLVEAEVELCSLVGIAVSRRAGECSGLMENMTLLVQSLKAQGGTNVPSSTSVSQRLTDYYSWLRQCMSVLVSSPIADFFFLATDANKLSSHVCSDMLEFLRTSRLLGLAVDKDQAGSTSVPASAPYAFEKGSWLRSTALVHRPNPTRVCSLSGHASVVIHAAWSSDEKRVATGSADHTARIWSVETGLAEQILSHTHIVQFVKFSADDAKLVTFTADNNIWVWDVACATVLHKLAGFTVRAKSTGDKLGDQEEEEKRKEEESFTMFINLPIPPNFHARRLTPVFATPAFITVSADCSKATALYEPAKYTWDLNPKTCSPTRVIQWDLIAGTSTVCQVPEINNQYLSPDATCLAYMCSRPGSENDKSDKNENLIVLANDPAPVTSHGPCSVKYYHIAARFSWHPHGRYVCIHRDKRVFEIWDTSTITSSSWDESGPNKPEPKLRIQVSTKGIKGVVKGEWFNCFKWSTSGKHVMVWTRCKKDGVSIDHCSRLYNSTTGDLIAEYDEYMLLVGEMPIKGQFYGYMEQEEDDDAHGASRGTRIFYSCGGTYSASFDIAAELYTTYIRPKEDNSLVRVDVVAASTTTTTIASQQGKQEHRHDNRSAAQLFAAVAKCTAVKADDALDPHPPVFVKFVWSPDSKLVASLFSNGVAIVDATTGEEKNSVCDVGSYNIVEAAWSSDGRLAVLLTSTATDRKASSGIIRIWHGSVGTVAKTVKTVQWTHGSLVRLAWRGGAGAGAGSDTLVVGCEDGHCYTLSGTTGKIDKPHFAKGGSAVQAVTWAGNTSGGSGTPQLLTSFGDNTLYLWKADKDCSVVKKIKFSSVISRIVVNSDATLASLEVCPGDKIFIIKIPDLSKHAQFASYSHCLWHLQMPNRLMLLNRTERTSTGAVCDVPFAVSSPDSAESFSSVHRVYDLSLHGLVGVDSTTMAPSWSVCVSEVSSPEEEAAKYRLTDSAVLL